jgi:hypothetical protein
MPVARVGTHVPDKYMIIAPTQRGTPPRMLAADTLAEAVQDVVAHRGQGVQTIRYNSKTFVWDGTTYVLPQHPREPKARARPPVETYGYSGKVSASVHPRAWTVGYQLKNHHERYFVYDTLKAAQADVQKNGGRTKLFHAGQPYVPPVDEFVGTDPAHRLRLPSLPTRRPSSYGEFRIRTLREHSRVRLYLDTTSRLGNEPVRFELWAPMNGSYWMKVKDLSEAKVLRKNTYNARYVVDLDPKQIESMARRVNGQFHLTPGMELALRGVWPSGHDQGASGAGVAGSGGKSGGFKLP